jgi:hypothetical protein
MRLFLVPLLLFSTYSAINPKMAEAGLSIRVKKGQVVRCLDLPGLPQPEVNFKGKGFNQFRGLKVTKLQAKCFHMVDFKTGKSTTPLPTEVRTYTCPEGFERQENFRLIEELRDTYYLGCKP